jgi:asparagine synthase (glutamine-hydrolysing)
MCGICGSSSDGGARVRAMNRALTHRGPDDSGVHVDEATGMALGATRLSIIDVEGGHQPLSNEDGTVWATLNGEVYNHPDLMRRLRERGHRFRTRSDTEVLVHLYEEYGDDLVYALDGMYAFAIWDAARRRLLIARDRFGEKPLFYREAGGTLTWASELSALLSGGVEVDDEQLDAYFVLGYVPGPRTLVRGICQLPPGHLLVWEGGRARLVPYWRPLELREESAVDEDELIVEAEQLLRESVRSRLIADVPLGVFLSGGLDSTLVTSFAAEVSSHRVQTFTVGYDVGGVNETHPAARTARAIGTDHHELVLRSSDVLGLAEGLYSRLDQPIADQALLASYAVSRFARERVKVVVGGEGADELFGGYPRYRWLALADRLERLLPPAGGRALAAAAGALPLRGRLQRLEHVLDPQDGFARHLDWVADGRPQLRAELYGPRLRASFGPERLAASLNGVGSADHGAQTVRTFMLLDQVLWLPDDVLAKADRSSMLASLEVRTPFLQPTLAAFAAGIPGRQHIRGGGKRILREVLRRRLPEMRGGRQKTAFRVPAADWLRGPLAETVRRQLDGPLYAGGWFRPDRVVAMQAEHAAGAADWTRVLWPLMVLAFWMEQVAA